MTDRLADLGEPGAGRVAAWPLEDHRGADVLGAPGVAETIAMPDDDEGAVVVTLVHRPPPTPTTRAVLYVHGFCDYFFQTHLADRAEALGYAFYAVDLRKYGRSLRAHQTPNFCTDLREYYPDLDAAATRIRERDGHDQVVVVAHSTGGLIAPLWAHDRHAEGHRVVDAFVLNGPWLDLHGSLLLRTVGTRAIQELGARRPYQVIPRSTSPVYVDSLHADRRGEWHFDLTWKSPASFPARAGWLRAVRRGHRLLHRGIDPGAPVLVLASTRSTVTETWVDAVTSSDMVLDVEQIARWSYRLGPLVTLARVEGAMHDAFLSAAPVREHAFAITERWLAAVLP